MDLVSHGTGSIVAFAPHRRIKQVGVKSFDVQFSKVPYSDAEGSFAKTWSQSGFASDFNSKHSYLECSVKDGVFTCGPRLNQYGSADGPDGYYTTHDVTVSSGSYTLKPRLDYLSIDLETRSGLIQTAPALYVNQTVIAAGRHFPTRYDRPYSTIMQPVAELGTSDSAHERITLDLSNENTKLLLSTPLFVYADRQYFKEHIVKPYNEFVKSSRMAFRLRAHRLHDKHNCTVLNDTIPADTTQLTFFHNSSTSKGQVVYQTQSNPGVDVGLVDSPQVSGPSATWYMLDIDNLSGSGTMWQTPALRFDKVENSTFGYMLSCAFDYTSDGLVFESRGIKVTVSGGDLLVNGVDTGLAMAVGTTKIMTIVKTQNTLDVNVWDYNGNQDYDTPVELIPETYTDTYSGTSISVGAGVTFGSWVYGRNTSASFVANARALVYTHTFGVTPDIDLGTLTDGTFSSGATWNAETNILTLVGVDYQRARPELTKQQQDIMRIPSKYVFSSVTAEEPSYTQRVRQADFYLQGLDGEALILSAHLPDDFHEIETPHLRETVSHKKTDAEYHIVCQDNQDMHFKELLPANAKATIVSSLLLV